MIYEFRTYDLKPGSLPKVLEMFGESYKVREKYSKLAAFFYTEIGPLNQIIHVWPYADLAERSSIRGEAGKEANWPPPGIHEHLARMQSEIYMPFPFEPVMASGEIGPIFEMRTYVVNAGSMPATMERWKPAIGKRKEMSPLVFVGQTEFGQVSKFSHIWAYKSLDHRAETRKAAMAKGVWPPPSSGPSNLVSQENKILLGAAFSPVK